jgi:PST family polysaccharide transporter/lipopolysaccharide exporter
MSYYSMAWSASRTPTGIFSRAICSVLVPTFARIQDEPKRVERGLRDCLQYSYLLVTPICIGLLVSAPDAVRVILGAKWLPLAPALRVMCVTVLASPLLDACNALVISTGRAQLSGISTGLRIATLLLIMQPLAHRWSVSGAAYGDMIALLVEAITLCLVARKALPGIKWPIASSLSRPVVASIFAGLLAWSAGDYLGPGLGRLAAQAAILFLFYPLAVITVGGRRKLGDLTLLLSASFKPRTAVAESPS